MDLWNKEITVANRFIYYYASFAKRIYGFVIRRDGDNVPDEHYVGHFAPQPTRQKAPRRRRRQALVQEDFHRQGDPKAPLPMPKGRWEGTPEPNEIVLFRYRKRLMLGYCQEIDRKTLSVVAEDRRRLTVRRSALIYLTGTDAADDSDLFRTYAASVRALSSHIDLEEVWELVREDDTPLAIADIASLYWAGEIDASRWAALCLHLDGGCPYFTSHGGSDCLPLASDEVQNRKHVLESRKALDEEWDEFLHWLASDADESYDPDTLTEKQQRWLEQVRQFALWGDEAQDRKQARSILSKVSPGSKSRQRRAFELLVSKGVWKSDENLDLVRSEIPTGFPDDVLQDANGVELHETLRYARRRRLRWRRLFSLDVGRLSGAALSLRRTWTGGYELGVHIPDVSAMVPRDSLLDSAASDRMATVELPDRTIPMLPDELVEGLRRLPTGEGRPWLSLLVQLDRQLNPRASKLVSTVAPLHHSLTGADARAALAEGRGTPLGRKLRALRRLSDQLREDRIRNGAYPPSDLPDRRVTVGDDGVQVVQTDASEELVRISDELALLASTQVSRWCADNGLDVMYETQRPPESRALLDAIPHPVVRRHEVRRQSPTVGFSDLPERHHGLGVSACCPVCRPADRYPDLVVQRQILHFLATGEPLHSREELDLIRFRAQEELDQFAGLRYRRERYLLLKHLSPAAGDIYPAVVLHLRRDGALVELIDLPLKSVVRPRDPVSVGDEIQLRLTGVDLWRSQAHFAVD